MFQLLVKLSLFFSLLVCASASSNEAGAKKLFARQTSNGIKPLMPTPPEKLKPSSKDYENLYTAIATEFAPTENMAKYLRFSLYELLTKTVGPDGCRAFPYYRTGNVDTLRRFVETKFEKILTLMRVNSYLDFSMRGNIYHVTRSLFIMLF